MVEYDPGPPPEFADHFAALPDLRAHKQLFWFSWGPIFYRGRLDGSARVICVASDPGPTERVVCRTLVGDAGQRVQGFLTKLGLSRSYVCVNAHPHAMFPAQGPGGMKLLAENAELLAWRNELYSMLMTPNIQAIVAFGRQAQRAVQLWPGRGATPVFNILHPSSQGAAALLAEWRQAVEDLRMIVTPDPDGDNTGPNYASRFGEADYAPIPKRDLPWGLPEFMGDDHWGRTASPKHPNCVSRPKTSWLHSIHWISPGE